MNAALTTKINAMQESHDTNLDQFDDKFDVLNQQVVAFKNENAMLKKHVEELRGELKQTEK